MGTQSQDQNSSDQTSLAADEREPPHSPDEVVSRSIDPDQHGGEREESADDENFDDEGYETSVRRVERPMEQQKPQN